MEEEERRKEAKSPYVTDLFVPHCPPPDGGLAQSISQSVGESLGAGASGEGEAQSRGKGEGLPSPRRIAVDLRIMQNKSRTRMRDISNLPRNSTQREAAT